LAEGKRGGAVVGGKRGTQVSESSHLREGGKIIPFGGGGGERIQRRVPGEDVQEIEMRQGFDGRGNRFAAEGEGAVKIRSPLKKKVETVISGGKKKGLLEKGKATYGGNRGLQRFQPETVVLEKGLKSFLVKG